MLDLKRVPKRNPLEPETAPKFYASASHGAHVDLDDLATEVADRCSLKRADVHGVLVGLMDIIPDVLLDGKIVSLSQLGSFYMTVKSEGAEIKDDLSIGMVKGVKIQYRPTKELKHKMKMVDFSFID